MKCDYHGRDPEPFDYMVKAVDAVKRIRELHYSVEDVGCTETACCARFDYCQECQVDYPCATIRVLEGEK